MNRSTTLSHLVLLILAAALLEHFAPLPARADGWPQFRHDAARSGYSPEELPADLVQSWKWTPPCPPAPAWKGEDTRMPFDFAFHTVAGRDRIYFGSSADGRVTALSAETGTEDWSVCTAGPIRLAPALLGDRLYVASDDGFLYCLDADLSTIVWKKRGGPAPDVVIGNGRMISRWPVRGGPVLRDGQVTYSAGIWPTEGIHIETLDARSGAPVWRNATSGFMMLNQPHGGAVARSGVSIQGYPALSDDTLLVPTGRAVPAAFERAGGAFRYFHLQAQGHRRTSPFISVVDGMTFNAHDIFRTSDGAILTQGVHALALAAFPEMIVFVRGDTICAVDRKTFLVEKKTVDRKGNAGTKIVVNDPLWTVKSEEPLANLLIGAGRTVVAGTKTGKIVTVDCDRPAIVTCVAVDGTPMGFSAAGGKLFVSTDTGAIHGFRPKGTALYTGGRIGRKRFLEKESHIRKQVDVAAAATEILERTGVTRGFCLDADCVDGALATELARRSGLRIVAVVRDAAERRFIRDRLSRESLLGTRITLLDGAARLPPYFADLIVSERSLIGRDRSGGARADLPATLRPFGGKLCVGTPGAMILRERGPLEGAGSWTHQYCDTANSNCSADTIVKGPLGVLWFADNDLEMPSRHGRGPAPLFAEGRLYVEGMHGLRCLNAYNGTVLWTHPLPGILEAYDQDHINGAAITGSNFCVADGVLHVRRRNLCHRLDARTGAELGAFEAPRNRDGSDGEWGYLACRSGLLYGSLFDTDHLVRWGYVRSDMSDMFSESTLLFALDAGTGRTRWTFTPEHSIRNNTIAVGQGKVFFIDRPIAAIDRLPDPEAEPAGEKKGVVAETGPGAETEHPEGKLVALDARTGKVLWERTDGIFGTFLALSEEHDVLLMGYQHTRFRLPSEKGGRMAAFRAGSGTPLWDVEAVTHSRHILNGDTIYAQPGAWDLLTGRKKDFHFTRSYGCGTLSGSKHLLAFRSATLGYRDLTVDRGTENYGAVRPGCWINALPAGGMLLLPEASNRCGCNYLIKATVALVPYGLRPARIEPEGGCFNRPVRVRLDGAECGGDGGGDGKLEIRYTLDGTDPTAASPLYGRPITIAEGAVLKTRTFREGAPPSQAAEAHFTIDPDMLILDGAGWSVSDAPGATPPKSAWRVVDGVAEERSNLYRGEAGDASPDTDRPGTLRTYDRGRNFTDGVLSLQVSSSDDDGLGVAFRLAGPEKYYLFAMDRQRGFHVLALKNGSEYTILAKNKASYDQNCWYDLRVELKRSEITVYVDGELDLEARDATLKRGTVALYSWGSTGAKFRSVRWK